MNNIEDIQNKLFFLSSCDYVNKTILQRALNRIAHGKPSREENTDTHFCSFFLPFDPISKKMFLGHHKKADDWIPPGGHIDQGETPLETTIREFQEELQIQLTDEKIELFDISITYINNPQFACKEHYNLWHIVEIPQQEFIYDPKEFYDAGWFTFDEAFAKTKRKEVLDVLREFSKRLL